MSLLTLNIFHTLLYCFSCFSCFFFYYFVIYMRMNTTICDNSTVQFTFFLVIDLIDIAKIGASFIVIVVPCYPSLKLGNGMKTHLVVLFVNFWKHFWVTKIFNSNMLNEVKKLHKHTISPFLFLSFSHFYILRACKKSFRKNFRLSCFFLFFFAPFENQYVFINFE